MLYLASLQQKFLLTKHDLTGRTRGPALPLAAFVILPHLSAARVIV